jgi:hypothetical protein
MKSVMEARVSKPVALAAVVCCAVGFALAQTAATSEVKGSEVKNFTTVTDQYLRNPSPDDWIMMRGNYEMWGYSTGSIAITSAS